MRASGATLALLLAAIAVAGEARQAPATAPAGQQGTTQAQQRPVFRGGTHKAMILDWLRAQGRESERTRVYGFTRSWSKIR